MSENFKELVRAKIPLIVIIPYIKVTKIENCFVQD